MLTIDPRSHDDLLVLRASGTVTQGDYHTTFDPAVEQLRATHPQLRLVYELGSAFDGYTAGAAWEDAKLGAHHLRDFAKIAIVTDDRLVRGATWLFGPLFPGSVKIFHDDEMQDAVLWAEN